MENLNQVKIAALRERLAEKSLRRAACSTSAALAASVSLDTSPADIVAASGLLWEYLRAERLIALAVETLIRAEHDERQSLLVMTLQSSETKHYTPRADADLCVALAPDAFAAKRVVAFFTAAGLTVSLQPRDAYRDAPSISRDRHYLIAVSAN